MGTTKSEYFNNIQAGGRNWKNINYRRRQILRSTCKLQRFAGETGRQWGRAVPAPLHELAPGATRLRMGVLACDRTFLEDEAMADNNRFESLRTLSPVVAVKA